jgi:Phage integrase family/Phage integrase SAM-like domain
MKTIHFNLRSLHAVEDTTILLVVNYNGFRIRKSTKEKVAVKAWNRKEQRALAAPNEKRYQQLNDRLDSLQLRITKLLNEQHYFSSSQLEELLTQIIEANASKIIPHKQSTYFWECYNAFVAYKRSTTQRFKDYDGALRKHLLATEAKCAIELTFDALHYNENGFVENFRQYLLNDAVNRNQEKGVRTNTVWKQFKNLKAFINWSIDQAFISKFSTKHIHARTESTVHVYLTEHELSQLESMELVGEEKLVRDVFLISCETGLRFSDVCCLTSTTSKTDFIEVYPKKTRKNNPENRILIPFSARLKRIISANHGKFPNYSYSKINRFNHLLREICKAAAFTSEVITYRIHHNKEVQITFQKYELVSSHTGRRTFCTLKFLAGMPSHAIMKFSGHTSEQNFLRYLKLDAEVVAERYKSFF